MMWVADVVAAMRLHLILALHIDYAQKLSVGREHDILDLLVVAWAWECGKYGRTYSSKKGGGYG